ncbi:MAG: peptidoglycan DD-metalloendopeptidase family protein [Cyclobacteriaceae bacterium]
MIRLIVLIIVFAVPYTATAQMFEAQEQIIRFGNRLNNPVTVRVEQTGNTLLFYAENKSYYPYKFEISFSKLVNLTPRTAGETRVLRHGMTRILKLTIEDENESPDYSYTIQYAMGDPSKEVDPLHPYLLPISPGKKFEAHDQTNNQVRQIFLNTFKTQTGDTIFAMRKGFVASLPDGNAQTDQLDEHALEIIHEDGSVALYKNADKSLVKYNQEVFPGQPIAIVGSSNYVIVRVYAFGNSQLRPVSMKFAVGDATFVDFKDIKTGSVVTHPSAVVERELSAKEIKRLKKSKN